MPSDASNAGGQSPARLEIRLLGTAEVILDGRRLRDFSSPRLQRFLALISMRREPQHRARLAFELWPDSSETQARTNLRKLLHELRHSLPDIDEFIGIGKETVNWLEAGSSHVDILAFHDAIATGDLELAARLYTGDLLPACYDDWILDERARLQNEARDVFVHMTQESANRGEHQATLRYAQRIVDLEPADEFAVHMQMRAFLALDDRIAAMRCYHRYAELLEHDFDLMPGDAIRDLYAELGAEVSAQGSGPGGGRVTVTESPFVGRDFEWKQFLEVWNAAREGRAHLLLLSGEAGIGKSRLAREFGRRVRADGYATASARAWEAAGRLPWGPVVDLLRSDALHGQVDSLDRVWRTELARLMPELADGTEPLETVSQDAIQRHRLFDAASRAITATDRPLLLIIDDLQWCDAETIELIGYVIRSKSAAAVLVAGTVRSEEIPEPHPLTAMVDSLARDGAVTSLQLERFDEATTTLLAARILAEESLDSKLVARLWQETEGNPLFVVEALRAGISSNDNEAVLTPTMRSVIRARLDQLSEAARRVAEAAAVVGRPFSSALIASVIGVDEAALVDRIDELWRRRIIRDQGLKYDFSHDKLRTVALELISPARLRQLHRAVAEALGAEAKQDTGAISPRLAAHFDRAGMVDAAIEAYRIAGARAVTVSALDEAVSLFRRALALLAEVPPSAERDELELDIRIALGSPLVALEGYGSTDSHRLYERAFALCRKLEKPIDPPILRGLGLARLQGCRFDDCDELARALVEHESRDPIARTEGRYLLGVSAFWKGDLETADKSLRNAIDSYDPSRRNEHLASYAQDPKAVCLVRLGLGELWAGDPGRADASARSALGIALELDHLMTLGYVYTYSAILAAEAGNLARLAELLEDADLLWQRLSEHYLVVVLDALRGWLEARAGSIAGIDKILRSATRSRNEGETLHLTYTLLLLARARASNGEFGEGRAAIQDALAWTRQRNQRYLESELWRVDGELAYRGGESDAALASLRKAVEVAHTQGAGWLELRALHGLTSRFSERGLRKRLESLLERIPSGRDLPAFRAASDFLRETN